jgi:hypothetical protein
LEVGWDLLCGRLEIPPREYLRRKLQQNASVVTSGSIVGSYFDDRTQTAGSWRFVVTLITVEYLSSGNTNIGSIQTT